MIGRTISHYAILEQIGQGGMGIVYKARDLRLNRFVALKFLPMGSISSKDLARLENEAKAISSLNHKNIATIYDIENTANQRFIVFEYLSGGTLKEKILRNGRLPMEEASAIALQIAEGLQHAHSKNIIHRDIKSDNIMFGEDGTAKITDFGISKIIPQNVQTTGESVIGTAPYMSPEQIKGVPLDYRTDIWSFGVVLYEMLSGCLPFKGELPQSLMYAILTEEPASVASCGAQIDQTMDAVVRKALEKELSKRYQSFGEVTNDLKRVKGQTDQSKFVEMRKGNNASTVRKAVLVAAGIALCILCLLWMLQVLSPWEIGKTRSILSFWKRNAAERTSVAVLPFKNLDSEKESEYFCDGVTEDIISRLSKIGSIRVISRTSAMRYKNTEKSIREVGNELGVGTILQGSVQLQGNHVRVYAQLVDAREDSYLWAETYDRDLKEIFAIQSNIASEISGALRATLTPLEQSSMTRSPTHNTDAYRSYLKGLYHWNKRSRDGFAKAIGYLQQAVELDSGFALAYDGLADCFSMMSTYAVMPPREAMPHAQKACQKALDIDPSLAEAHTSLGFIQMVYEWKWEEAEKSFRRSIELNPSYSNAHHWYALYLATVGKEEKALEEISRAEQLDPLSLIISSDRGWILYRFRRYDEAVRQYEKTIEMDPGFSPAQDELYLVYIAQGKLDETISELQKSGHARAYLACAYGLAGRYVEASKILGDALANRHNDYQRPSTIASICANMGDKNGAFHWLQKAVEGKDTWLIFLNYPLFDSIRSDPRFRSILNEMGL